MCNKSHKMEFKKKMLYVKMGNFQKHYVDSERHVA
jgi:hypothetical protein